MTPIDPATLLIAAGWTQLTADDVRKNNLWPRGREPWWAPPPGHDGEPQLQCMAMQKARDAQRRPRVRP